MELNGACAPAVGNLDGAVLANRRSARSLGWQSYRHAIVRLLDDVQETLETLGEQKVVVDHVAERVAQLDFVLQEARNTQRTLQHERELAERIEQSIKQLRSQRGAAEERRRTA